MDGLTHTRTTNHYMISDIEITSYPHDIVITSPGAAAGNAEPEPEGPVVSEVTYRKHLHKRRKKFYLDLEASLQREVHTCPLDPSNFNHLLCIGESLRAAHIPAKHVDMSTAWCHLKHICRSCRCVKYTTSWNLHQRTTDLMGRQILAHSASRRSLLGCL